MIGQVRLVRVALGSSRFWYYYYYCLFYLCRSRAPSPHLACMLCWHNEGCRRCHRYHDAAL